MRLPFLAVVSALVALPAGAQDIRPQEQSRLARFEQIAGEALLEALAGGTPDDVGALTAALSGPPQVAFDPDLDGEWNCRTMKLGGLTALTVYTPFKCRLTVDLTGVRFEKLTGSQRTSGRIELRDGRAIYLGVGHVASEDPQNYADLSAEFEGSGTITPDVAVFERVSRNRARLLFPAPVNESDFDILELTR